MNAKYCKLIRKVVRDWGYQDRVAKKIKKDLIKNGITTPSIEFLCAVLETVEKKMKA